MIVSMEFSKLCHLKTVVVSNQRSSGRFSDMSSEEFDAVSNAQWDIAHKSRRSSFNEIKCTALQSDSNLNCGQVSAKKYPASDKETLGMGGKIA
jgi:hypothetical protein